MIIYFLCFFLLVLFCYYKNDRKIFYFSMFVLCFICASRESGVDRDYETYISIYKYIIDGYSYAIEPTFYFIAIISNKISGSPELIFITYATLAILFKLLFIRDWSPYLMLSVLIYYSNIFLLHEMTQIRIGLASAIAFYSLKFLIENQKAKYFLLIIVAILFHFSVAVFLLIPLLSQYTITARYKICYFSALISFYLLYLLKVDASSIIGYINIGVVQDKFRMYQQQVSDEGVTVNVFSAIQLLHIVIVCFTLLYSSYFISDKKNIMMIKIYSLSPLCLIAFSTIPGFSLRLSELFSVSEIVLIPMIVNQFKQSKIAYMGAITLSLLILILNLYNVSLVKEYIV